MLLGISQDVRQGLRRLCRNPAFTLVAIATLAFGIGVSAAIFDLVDRVLLQPLPFSKPGQLVRLRHHLHSRGLSHLDLTETELLYHQEHRSGLQRITAFYNDSRNLSLRDESLRAGLTFVLPNFFSLLGVQPVAGRDFQAEEGKPGAPRVAILDYGFWISRFAGQADILGSTLLLDEIPYTVIGVMASDFDFPPTGRVLWAPFQIDPSHPERDSNLQAIGRLREGMDLAAAQRQVNQAAQRFILDQSPQTTAESLEEAGWGAWLEPLRSDLSRRSRGPLLVLLGAVALLLISACANVSALLLARAAGRTQEIALRKATGASHFRILRLLAVENLLLFLGSGLAGLLVARGLGGALLSLAPADLSLESAPMDWRLPAFALAASLLSGLFFGLLPARQASQNELSEALKSGRGAQISNQRRLWRGLVVAEIALATVLLAVAGLMLKSLSNLTSVEAGYSADDLLTLRLSLPISSYEQPRALQLFQDLLDEVRSQPGVESAGGTSGLPLGQENSWGWGRIYAEEASGAVPVEANESRPFLFADRYAILTGYFESLGVKLLEGRAFDAGDDRGAPRVAIIDRDLADAFWPGQSPLGRRIATGTGADPRWTTVIGLVEHLRDRLESPGRPQVWFPYTQATFHSAYLTIRSAMPPQALLARVEELVRARDSRLPVFDIQTMEERRDRTLSGPRFSSLLLTIFACAALLLAILGTYGIVSYAFSQRTREIGVRRALGAQRGHVLSMVLREGLLLGGCGALLGIAMASVASRLASGLLFEVSPTDPLPLLLAPALLLAATAAACLLPAKRAVRIDPSSALRHD